MAFFPKMEDNILLLEVLRMTSWLQVNEDWNEGYANGNQGSQTEQGRHNYSDDPTYDDSADGFSGSVKA